MDETDETDDMKAALQLIAELGGKTLITDPGYSSEIRAAYSQGAAHAFEQAAEIARTALTREENG